MAVEWKSGLFEGRAELLSCDTAAIRLRKGRMAGFARLAECLQGCEQTEFFQG
jgi:hypothetical protein